MQDLNPNIHNRLYQLELIGNVINKVDKTFSKIREESNVPFALKSIKCVVFLQKLPETSFVWICTDSHETMKDWKI